MGPSPYPEQQQRLLQMEQKYNAGMNQLTSSSNQSKTNVQQPHRDYSRNYGNGAEKNNNNNNNNNNSDGKDRNSIEVNSDLSNLLSRATFSGYNPSTNENTTTNVSDKEKHIYSSVNINEGRNSSSHRHNSNQSRYHRKKTDEEKNQEFVDRVKATAYRQNIPDYIPGTASFFEQINKRILVIMHSGRHLVGKLYTYDQFGNVALSDAYERFFTKDGKFYGDVSIGKMYIVRGDTVILLGEEKPYEETDLKGDDTDGDISNIKCIRCTGDEIMEKLQEEIQLKEEEEANKGKKKDESDSDTDSDSSDEEEENNDTKLDNGRNKNMDLKSVWKFEY